MFQHCYWPPLLLLLPLFCCSAASIVSSGDDADLRALIAFRDGITGDPNRVLSSWNDSTSICEWRGVVCSESPPWRVTKLNISGGGMIGRLSHSISNLTFLRLLELSGNQLYGEIPRSIGSMDRLEALDMEGNSFEGEIPSSLANCSSLQAIGLSSNRLTGAIPAALATLSKLELLYLDQNSLSGVIPPEISNLTELVVLSLMKNKLSGNIPADIGRLKSLEMFHVASNKLSGTIPAQLCNISSLWFLSAANNQLNGSFQPGFGLTLPNLQQIVLGGNSMEGTIPASLSNSSKLQYLSMDNNYLTGEIPSSFGRLRGLKKLNLRGNAISNGGNWEFLDALTNCTELQRLYLDENNFGGALPDSVAALSPQLLELFLNYNQITGKIPSGIANMTNLVTLGIGYNSISGSIPASITKLTQLQELIIFFNNLTGLLPTELGNMTQLAVISLNNNDLEGTIPPSIGKLQHLLSLQLSNNRLNQTVPPEIFYLPAVIDINLSENSLSGSLPPEVGNMQNLETLNAFGNDLSGEIPVTLGNCPMLNYIDMSRNSIGGEIPRTMNNLKALTHLDLSHNKLSGPIDGMLDNLTLLIFLDLSFNNLQGEVPEEGVYKNASAISLNGNGGGLCGGVSELNLPPCSSSSLPSSTKSKTLSLKILISNSVAAICFISFSVFCTILCVKRIRERVAATMEEIPSLKSSQNYYPKVSYEELRKATENFSPANMIGRGAHGCVYKCELGPQKTIVAVKVFNLRGRGAPASFKAENGMMRNIRHRNLIKILSSCSAIDPKGQAFKALVYEFIPNGSLEAWIHPRTEDGNNVKSLNLITRLSIAIDIAEALLYLHNGSQSPIAHCDLKPSNVLLDGNMTARLSDFGLARFVARDRSRLPTEITTTSIGVRGSVGYIAPEFGSGGRASTSSDVYSYGIMVLEIFTGRRPVDELFKDGMNLHKFVERALPDRAMEVMDPRILASEDNGSVAGCLVSALKVGLSCSNQHPGERIKIRDAAAQMNAIKSSYLHKNSNGGGTTASIDQAVLQQLDCN